MFDNYNDVLTVEQAMTALSIGKNSMYMLLQSKAIKSIKIGKKYIIPKKFIIDYINAAAI